MNAIEESANRSLGGERVLARYLQAPRFRRWAFRICLIGMYAPRR